MTLRNRLGMLRGVFGNEMPYRDPHMAGPALWALRHASGLDFEVSVLPVEGTTQWRKGLEALAISLYRQQNGKSPSVNFGRMPLGYRPSSHNNLRLVTAGRRYRGGPTAEFDESHRPGISPMGLLTGNPLGSTWCGHEWCAWVPAAELVRSLASCRVGFYRLRGSGADEVLYVGQGNVKARVTTHLMKVGKPEHRQGRVFAEAPFIEASWAAAESLTLNQLLELENDLIAAHVLMVGRPQAAQFLG